MDQEKALSVNTNDFKIWRRLVFGAHSRTRTKSTAWPLTIVARLTCAAMAVLLLCDCRREAARPNPAATPSPAATVSATPVATPSAPLSPTPNPLNKPGASPTPSATPVPAPSPTPVVDPFEEGLKQLLQASQFGFRDLHGKLKRTETGSGPEPLFRLRKVYEGTFLFGGAVSAEIEEVYFHAGKQPVYNYHLYFQALSARESIDRYDNLRQELNHALQSFEHTFGDRYDAWESHDALKTAVLLSNQDAAGSPEIQLHVAFSAPQW
jgi:hypothetical protein